jgi:2-phospho-L-lactate guanylyltransferase (CobY/MobA/RfbA family)
MIIPILLAILITSIVAHAGDNTPVVVPVKGTGTATTS